MNDRHIYLQLEQAQHLLQQGSADTAIQLLKQILSIDPDFAEAHAILALALLQKRRLYAAEYEANLALTLAPELAEVHYVIAQILIAKRYFDKALEHAQHALEIQPEEASYYHLIAMLYSLMHRFDLVEDNLLKALTLQPEDADILVSYGEYYLERKSDLLKAYEKGYQALQLYPEHSRAHILMGQIALQQGDISMAREHAFNALKQDPENRAALYLFTAIKTRINPFLGLWWRYNTWMSHLGDGRAILVLLGIYILYRLSSLLAVDSEQYLLANTINLIWLGIVLYTWIGPVIFMRALKKELQNIQLSKDF